MPSPHKLTLHELLIQTGFIPVTSVLTTIHPDLDLVETAMTIRNITIENSYHVLVTDDQGMIWMIWNGHLLPETKEQIVQHFNLTWLPDLGHGDDNHLPPAA